MFEVAIEFLKSEKTSLTEIRFTNFDETTVSIFEEVRILVGVGLDGFVHGNTHSILCSI